MVKYFSALVVCTLALVPSAEVRAIADVSINPPTTPVSVGRAHLTYTRHVNVPRVTRPGSFILTDTVSNDGTVAAQNVQIQFELPPGMTHLGQTSIIDRLGTIPAGQIVTRTYLITVGAEATPGRYANEAIVSGTDVDSIMADAIIDISQPAVLGAATLAETGSTSWPAITLGISFAIAGWWLFRRLSA